MCCSVARGRQLQRFCAVGHLGQVISVLEIAFVMVTRMRPTVT
ncbi:hypothetical protein ANAPC5_00928 [Anaplasma phagocytophilum]|nr:hypothetical protein ANAPC2_01116 [Anaplasma phagocytophilum]SBO33285.1 hypothetical protein ANAPC3_01166 [Anaplasma phagocytophilum]SBO33391.1 hypothetical protein ANAPC4_01137 [Anaplasma phagocytophilum]SCV64663.1 hypothetical protein ANAPC5_00928 [Anaplasma phagocytophilum]